MGAMPQDPFIREKFTRDMLTIDAAIHDAVMALPPDERRDRAKVNEAVRNGSQTWAVAPYRKWEPVWRSEGNGRIKKPAESQHLFLEQTSRRPSRRRDDSSR